MCVLLRDSSILRKIRKSQRLGFPPIISSSEILFLYYTVGHDCVCPMVALSTKYLNRNVVKSTNIIFAQFAVPFWTLEFFMCLSKTICIINKHLQKIIKKLRIFFSIIKTHFHTNFHTLLHRKTSLTPMIIN